MIRYQRSISFLSILFIITIVGVFYFSTGYLVAINMWLIIGVILISLILTWRQLFLVVLSIILIVGFSLIFITEASIQNQFDLIWEHILLSASLLLIWVITGVVKFLEQRLIDQEAKIKTLEKYQGSTEILSLDEFKSRVHLITRGTDRRKETNMVVEFSLTAVKTTEKAMHAYIAETLLDSIRNEFDLVTKLDNKHYLVFLQDTSDIGVEKVTERFFNTIRHHLNEIELPVSYCYYHAEDYDFERFAPKEGDES
ncbi:hypothetical protein SAMN05421839_10545 [Halolactibacillus halophilus]|uniref:GGDEF domain-containing protein, diguanylate cyclase (C-di-GMP synthetase) or its enzymatically inactive variants n=1 Tax=Halolactibacillus halophilus TaxID=306540 RepID=A0A1I5MFQ0_9BACI|nr:hypothetical protein [Halolactibacillus halophilus]GEM02485.1 hypothetical protein HHA03_20170 [Halolactibacillus halophilus]SFP07771.1 hypothetical protein SAMN05421839_10545 [Halolactibacillus halophilus]